MVYGQRIAEMVMTDNNNASFLGARGLDRTYWRLEIEANVDIARAEVSHAFRVLIHKWRARATILPATMRLIDGTNTAAKFVLVIKSREFLRVRTYRDTTDSTTGNVAGSVQTNRYFVVEDQSQKDCKEGVNDSTLAAL